MDDINEIFSRFPKSRSLLSAGFLEIYERHYRQNRTGETPASSLSRKMETWLHKKVAADVVNDHHKSTLELGAGTLNQLKYESTGPYDVVEPFTELYSKSADLNRVRKIYTDIDEIGASEKYDRITAIATFEHLTDLPRVVAKTCLLLDELGCLRISIPNEGTFLWKLGWKLTTGLEFRLSYGLDYGLLMAHEHVNTAYEIDRILRHFYEKVECSCFGINKSIAFYRFYLCTGPMKGKASEYLKSV
ncbi:MAG: class I SAM-dependent methyltransferase [Bacteroidales bacterium]|nr:class I SAM-dependent methyltransferase [Bacteroidales bacterium]